MSSCSYRRAWEAPVATELSIRCTAGSTGPGPDNFLKFDYSHRPNVAPTAPLADVGALPVPSHIETAKAADAEQRTWEGPSVTTLVI